MKTAYLLATLSLCLTIPTLAARTLEDAVSRLDREPGREDVPVNFTGVVTGLADKGDLVVASGQRIVVVDLPPQSSVAEFPIGSVIEVRGELERAPKWAELGTRFEVDAKAVSLQAAAPGVPAPPVARTKAATRMPGSPAPLTLEDGISVLRENRRIDDIPVAFEAVVKAWHEEDEMTVDAAGTRVKVDLPYGQHAIAFPIGSRISITGTLDRRARLLPGPRFEVYARSLALSPAVEALP